MRTKNEANEVGRRCAVVGAREVRGNGLPGQGAAAPGPDRVQQFRRAREARLRDDTAVSGISPRLRVVLHGSASIGVLLCGMAGVGWRGGRESSPSDFLSLSQPPSFFRMSNEGNGTPLTLCSGFTTIRFGRVFGCLRCLIP